jgi:hypothetical protein
MPFALKPFLLSALVFPGLGQLYKQDRKKGVILLLLANLLFGLVLLGGLVLFSQEYMAVYYPAPLTGEILTPLFLKVTSHPLFFLPALVLLGLWAYGAIDAARVGHSGNGAAPPPREET